MKYYFPCKPNRIMPESETMDRLSNDHNWIAEVKKNGDRCLPTIGEHQAVTFWSRHKTISRVTLAEEGRALIALPPNTILDGELLNYKRIKNGSNSLYLFDIIMLEGKLLISERYATRRLILESLWAFFLKDSGIELAKQFTDNKKELYYQSITTPENEGIVIKHLNGGYPASENRCLQNPLWLKVKRPEAHTRRSA